MDLEAAFGVRGTLDSGLAGAFADDADLAAGFVAGFVTVVDFEAEAAGVALVAVFGATFVAEAEAAGAAGAVGAVGAAGVAGRAGSCFATYS